MSGHHSTAPPTTLGVIYSNDVWHYLSYVAETWDMEVMEVRLLATDFSTTGSPTTDRNARLDNDAEWLAHIKEAAVGMPAAQLRLCDVVIGQTIILQRLRDSDDDDDDDESFKVIRTFQSLLANDKANPWPKVQ